jgi:hypothetical protein
MKERRKKGKEGNKRGREKSINASHVIRNSVKEY